MLVTVSNGVDEMSKVPCTFAVSRLHPSLLNLAQMRDVHTQYFAEN